MTATRDDVPCLSKACLQRPGTCRKRVDQPSTGDPDQVYAEKEALTAAFGRLTPSERNGQHSERPSVICGYPISCTAGDWLRHHGITKAIVGNPVVERKRSSVRVDGLSGDAGRPPLMGEQPASQKGGWLNVRLQSTSDGARTRGEATSYHFGLW